MDVDIFKLVGSILEMGVKIIDVGSGADKTYPSCGRLGCMF